MSPISFEEERAAVAFFEFSGPLPRGPGEGPLLVPEQLALQKRFRNRRAIDCQKRVAGAVAVLMNGPRYEFFAGSALAPDKHIDVLIGNASDRLVHFEHGGAAADQDVGACSACAGRVGPCSPLSASCSLVMSPMVSAWLTTSRILAMSRGLRK